MASSSSSSSMVGSEDDSDSDILHELCNNVNLGLAKAGNATVDLSATKAGKLNALKVMFLWFLCTISF